jgi:hypothetical protein
MTRIYAGRKPPAGWPMPAGVLEGMVDPQTGLLLASGCAPWSGVAYKELFVQGAVPVTVCPSQGPIMTAEMLPMPPLPDYEEGMETGVPLEEVPKTSTPGGEPVRLGDGTTATEPMRSYTPSSPLPAPSVGVPAASATPASAPAAAPAAKPAAPPAEEPASEPVREASPDPGPSPTPSPGLPL